MHASPDWNAAQVRVLYLNNDNSKKKILEEAIRRRMEPLRVEAQIEVINNELERKPFYEIVKINSFESDLIVFEMPKIEQDKERDFVSKTNDLLDILGTTVIVSASSHFYEEESYDPELEKRYQAIDHTSQEVKVSDSVALAIIGNNSIDAEVVKFDKHMYELNEGITEYVYDKFEDTYNTCVTLIKEKFEEALASGKIDQFLPQAINLLEDLGDNRLPIISKSISEGIEGQIKEIRNYVEELPDELVRLFSEEELAPLDTDSNVVRKLKRKNLRKLKRGKVAKVNVRYRDTAQHHFENGYLFKFREELNILGISGFILNNTLKDWINDVVKESDDESLSLKLKELTELVAERIAAEKARFLRDLNGLGRKFCNSIAKDLDKLDINRVAVDRDEDHSAREVKKTFITIAEYPKYWLANQQYLNNKLVTAVNLNYLRLNILPFVHLNARKISYGLIADSNDLFQSFEERLDDVTKDELEIFEQKLIAIGGSVSVEKLINTLVSKIEKGSADFKEEVEVMAPLDINSLETKQENITPLVIKLKKVTNHVLENEIVAQLKEAYQLSYNEGRAEIIKIENAIRLIKFTMLSKEDDGHNLTDVKHKVREQLTKASEHMKVIESRLNQDIDSILESLSELMTEEMILNRADHLDGVILKEKTRRGINQYVKKASGLFERLNNGYDKLIIKVRDLLAISGYQYRTKSLQNPHERLSNFADKVSLSKDLSKKIPFYYKQLFEGKHIAPDKPLANRKNELELLKKAFGRFYNGMRGAILVTGEPLSGKSYLAQNAANVYSKNDIVSVIPPFSLHKPKMADLTTAFRSATGLEGSIEHILDQLQPDTTILLEDMELWWNRNPEGSVLISKLVELMKTYSNKHLFIVDCNVFFYQHIRQYTHIDNLLLATVSATPFKVEELKEAVMDRHKSGGLRLIWKNKYEDELRLRELNQLFKRMATVSSGNIGIAFQLWMGNIKELEGSDIRIGKFDLDPLPEVMSEDWELMLLQIILHKQIGFDQLCEVYVNEPKDKVNDFLQSLIRSGMVVEKANNVFGVSNYMLPYILREFRRKQLVN